MKTYRQKQLWNRNEKITQKAKKKEEKKWQKKCYV